MKVVLDTTALFSDFRLMGTAFRVFRGGLPRLGWELVIPQVVFDETVNHYTRKILDLQGELESARRGLERHLKLDSLGLKLSPELDCESEKYSLYLSGTLREMGAKVAPYPDISHEYLARRAMHQRKPFNSKGAGYRDSLIWETVVGLLESDPEGVRLVTNNKSDFGAGPNLDRDLLDDLEQRGYATDLVRIVSSVDDLNRIFITPHLKPLDELAEDIRRSRVAHFRVKEWILRDLAPLLDAEGDGCCMSPVASDESTSHVLEIQTLHGWSVDDVRLIPPGDFLVFITADADVVLQIETTWEQYRRYLHVRGYSGPNVEAFEEVSTNETIRCRIGFSLVLEKDTFNVLAFEANDFASDSGHVEFNVHPRTAAEPG